MSHFTVLVITPYTNREDYSESELDDMLLPYNENIEAEPYDKKCHCIGCKAKMESQEIVGKKFATIEQIRKQKNLLLKTNEVEAEEYWISNLKQYDALLEEEISKHPLKDSPEADCEECNGTGLYSSTYNPKSKWDWYMIGGRWSGSLTGYDVNTDPSNFEQCDLCQGTGLRNDNAAIELRKTKPEYTCNGCNGEGKHLKYYTNPYDGDICKVKDIKEDFRSFAVLTPHNEWHEKGEMGWWAVVTNEKSDWDKQYDLLIKQYAENIAVLVDCHI